MGLFYRIAAKNRHTITRKALSPTKAACLRAETQLNPYASHR